jgi:hypothetical protein
MVSLGTPSMTSVTELGIRVEIAVVISCACIPTLPQLILKILGRREQHTYRLSDYPQGRYPRMKTSYSDGRVRGDSVDPIIQENGQKPVIVGGHAATQNLEVSHGVVRPADIRREWHVV